MAAVLACGEGAVLSHASAVVLWGLLRPIDGPVHVSVPTTSGRKKRRGIHLRRSSLLPPRLVRRAIRQAESMGLRLDGVETDRTRSDLETLFLGLCRRHRLPSPAVNVKLGRWEVDFLWRTQRLVVEVDPWAYHRGSVAFEDDHARDLDLRAAGYAVLRFSERQLEKEPERVVADVVRALTEER